MRKRTTIFIITSFITTVAWGATRDAQLTETTPYNYNYMYPYLNNQMRTNLNPGTINSQSQNPINAVVKTQKLSGTRRVVPRPHLVRSATSGTKYGTSNRDKTPIVEARSPNQWTSLTNLAVGQRPIWVFLVAWPFSSCIKLGLLCGCCVHASHCDGLSCC